MCPECGNPILDCSCGAEETIPDRSSIVRISRETKGRKGKGVTIITGLPLGREELKQTARKLKQLCGTGGTLKDRAIEIQGDHREKLYDTLKKQGFNVKLAGG